jgi:hypothetical protein
MKTFYYELLYFFELEAGGTVFSLTMAYDWDFKSGVTYKDRVAGRNGTTNLKFNCHELTGRRTLAIVPTDVLQYKVGMYVRDDGRTFIVDNNRNYSGTA